MYQILFLFILSLQQINLNIEKSIAYHTKMADKYYHDGNFPNMLYHLQQKVKLDPHDVNSYSDLAYYYWSMSINEKHRTKEFMDKANLYLKEGLSKNKNSAYMWDEIGQFLIISSKNYKDSIPYFIESMKRNDSPMSTFHLLSLAYTKENKITEAIQVLESCIKKFPNDEKAKSKLKQLKINLNGG